MAPFINTSFIKEKVIRIEWIMLSNEQAQEIHDYAFELSENMPVKSQGDVLYNVSDLVQRNKLISVKQLSMLMAASQSAGFKDFYCVGLEQWMAKAKKKRAGFAKIFAKKSLRRTGLDI